MSETRGEVTELLVQLGRGRDAALDELLPLVYQELRRIARYRMRGERETHTLRTTALVHEAYERLVDHHAIDWQDRNHFFAVAARAMRQVLVDHARRRNAQKRGGDVPHIPLEEHTPATGPPSASILAVNEALARLEELDARQAKVVESRFFAGLTIQETASALGVSPSTVKRDWRTARAWLAREIGPDARS